MSFMDRLFGAVGNVRAQEPAAVGTLIANIAHNEVGWFTANWKDRLASRNVMGVQVELAVLLLCVTDRLAERSTSFGDRKSFMTIATMHARNGTIDTWPEAYRATVTKHFDETLDRRLREYSQATSIFISESDKSMFGDKCLVGMATILICGGFYDHRGAGLPAETAVEAGVEIMRTVSGLLVTPSYKAMGRSIPEDQFLLVLHGN